MNKSFLSRLGRVSRLPLLMVVLIVSLAAPSTLITAAPNVGQATTQLTASTSLSPYAYGYMLKGAPGAGGDLWFGSLRSSDGSLGYCSNYGWRLPNGQRFEVGSIPGLNWLQQQKIAFLMSAHGVGRGALNDGAVYGTMSLIINGPGSSFMKGWPSYQKQLNTRDRRVVPLVYRYLQEANTLHGPYQLSVRFTHTALVGQTGTAMVSLRSGAHRPVPNTALQYVVTSAQLLHAPLRTDHDGNAVVTFRRTQPDTVTLSVKSLLARQAFGLTSAGWHVQRLVSPSRTPRAWVSARATYNSSPHGPTYGTNCNSDCGDNTSVTFTVANAAGSAAMRWSFTVDDQEIATIDVASGKTATTTAALHDGDKVQPAYCYLSAENKCTTAPIKVGKPFEVICPPRLALDETKSTVCPAGGGKAVQMVHFSLSPPSGTTRYYVVTITDGSSTKQLAIAPTTSTANYDLSLRAGADVKVTSQAYRDATHRQRLGNVQVLDDFTQNS